MPLAVMFLSCPVELNERVRTLDYVAKVSPRLSRAPPRARDTVDMQMWIA
jgi:hypothetical protein